jgi:hypothetical protein
MKFSLPLQRMESIPKIFSQTLPKIHNRFSHIPQHIIQYNFTSPHKQSQFSCISRSFSSLPQFASDNPTSPHYRHRKLDSSSTTSSSSSSFPSSSASKLSLDEIDQKIQMIRRQSEKIKKQHSVSHQIIFLSFNTLYPNFFFYPFHSHSFKYSFFCPCLRPFSTFFNYHIIESHSTHSICFLPSFVIFSFRLLL